MTAAQPGTEAAKADLLGDLLSIETGLYAITHMTRVEFDNGTEADAARHGIHYVALKLERDLQAIINPLAAEGGL